jgi:topoisomerase-4 subunit A
MGQMTERTSANITPVDFEQALHERYLSYALSTIMARSLPDVRDGLKPVHRRLIYAMHQLRLNPETGFKKCARVVGDVMGKFHPHGDAAIYGALVRLAQDFSVRYPLIEGQGNFGNIDGDAAAAMRYTEARLSKVAMALMEGLDENAVEFRSTYDGEGEEPMVFPAAFPNLLANGATGIAVGMATSIPPHNVDEICQALILLIEKPEASIEELLTVLPAPDFPTGGILAENPETLLKAYQTGRGSFRVRARWEVETLKGGGYRIIVTEIPYQVEKSKLIEKIATLLNEKKLLLLDDITDESADDIRLVLQPKSRNVEAAVLMESLFRLTDLEVRVPLNMNALDGQNIPRVMSLKEVLKAFLDHRFVVQERRSRYRLEQIANRLEILSGYLITYLNLDEVIRIIRDEDDAKSALIQRFNLTVNQVEAILNMRLRSLRKLQEIEIRQEYEALQKEQAVLEQLLASTKLRWKSIRQQIESLRKNFGQHTDIGRRRTTITHAPEAIVVPLVDTIEAENVTVVFSLKNWLRCVKGHNITTPLTYKEGDSERFILPASTTDKLVIFATNGRFYTLGVDKLPRTRGHGEPIRLLIDLPDTEEVLNVFVVPGTETDKQFLVIASDGRGFLVLAKDVLAQTRLGKQVLTPADGAVARFCLPITGDQIACIGENRKMLIFPVSELPIMSRGRGVTLQKYKDGSISDIKIFSSESGLQWNRTGKITTVTDLRPWQGKRAAAGHLAPIGFPRTNKFQ